VDRKAARAEAAGAHKVSDEEVEDDEIGRSTGEGTADDRAARRTERRHDGL